MATLRPFRALRPKPELADKICELPYDVMSSDEAREIANDNPLSFLHVSNFTINLYGKYLCYAILAISVDLLWGYIGLLSLGQALFFSLGGYMMGMYLMRMIGDLGQYHKAIPDFLVFLGWSTLPAFWKPFSSFPFALIMACLLPGLLALVFGYLAFRSRIRGVYFSILTQALWSMTAPINGTTPIMGHLNLLQLAPSRCL